MTSVAVADDTDMLPVWRELRRTMDALNYTCLAAIHIGLPMRAAIVDGGADGPVQLVNPVRVAGVGGDSVSTGHETSAWYPLRAPARVVRQLPVLVRDGRGLERLFEDRAEAHCVLHVLDALDGITPYDRRM